MTISNTLKFPHLTPRILFAPLYDDNGQIKAGYILEKKISQTFNLFCEKGQKSVPLERILNDSMDVSTEFPITFLLACIITHVVQVKAVYAVVTKDFNRPFSLSVITGTESVNVKLRGSI
jgi:hypothetical protein